MPPNFKSHSNRLSNLTKSSQTSKTLEEDDDVVFVCEVNEKKKQRKRKRAAIKKEIKQEAYQGKKFEESSEVVDITDTKEIKVNNLKSEKKDSEERGEVSEERKDIGCQKNVTDISDDEGPVPFDQLTPIKAFSVKDEIYASPLPSSSLSDVSTLPADGDVADQDTIPACSDSDVADQDTIPICEKWEDDLELAYNDSEVDDEISPPPTKKSRKATRAVQGGCTHLLSKGVDLKLSIDGNSKSNISISKNAQEKQPETFLDDSDIIAESSIAPSSDSHPTIHISSARKPDLVDKEIQVELPTLELTNLKALVDEQKSLLAKKNVEIEELEENLRLKDEDHQLLMAEKTREMENLNENFKQKYGSQQALTDEMIQEIEGLQESLRQKCIDHERLMADKTREIESLKETLTRKEIGLVAVTSMFSLSLDECVRKTAEAQTARAALTQQLVPIANAQVQSPNVSQSTCSCAAEKSGKPDERDSAPIDLSSKVDTSVVDNSQPAPSSGTAGIPCKDEFSRRDRPSVNGVYVDAFPLQPDILQGFASSSNASAFVRAVMLHCFTDEYLKAKTFSQLKETHVDEITDATITHFTHYRTRKDSEAQSLNRPTVRTFITNMLTVHKKKAQTKVRKA